MITNTFHAKKQADMRVAENIRLGSAYSLLKLTAADGLPEMMPGQFVQIRIEGAASTFLRLPISIHYVDREANELWLLIRKVGEGTRRLSEYARGDCLNLIFPLGRGFSMPQERERRLLLTGGGVGAAPMLFLGEALRSRGFRPVFLLGARTEDELVPTEGFREIGETHLTTEDGSAGERGFVTDHSILSGAPFDRIYACGPKPMMMAVARRAAALGAACEVSLENMMACGTGACLCCIEKTARGNLRVCSEGPVFDAAQLTW